MDPYIYSPCGGLSKPPGIRNEGNICYVTSIFQCMLSVDALKDSLCQAVWSTDNTLPILQALEELFIDMIQCCKAPHYSCEKFLLVLQAKWQLYRPGEQEDCRSFLQFVLDSIHEETLVTLVPVPTFMKNTTVQRTIIQAWFLRERSPVSDMFGCLTVRQIFCDNSVCDSSSAHCDPASFYLTLNLPNAKNCSLQDCLRLWTSEAKYQSDAECHECSTLDRKSFLKMGRLPPFLTIHLARFVYNVVSGEKNYCFVKYEHQLDMKEFVVDGLHTNTSYSLVAVTCHSGGLASGHYTSYCKSDGRWFFCDDSKVSSTTTKRVLTGDAYLLWYKLREDQPGKLPFDAPAAALPVPPVPPAAPPVVDGSPHSDSENTYVMSSFEVSSDSQEFTETDTDGPPPKIRKKSATAKEVINTLAKVSVKPIPPQKNRKKSATAKEVINALAKVSLKPIPPQKNRKKAATDKVIIIPPAKVSVRPIPSEKGGKEISFQQDTEVVEACNHEEVYLDIRDPVLNRADVDGGDVDVDDLESYRKPALERLMRMYGLPVPSTINRPEIIERIRAHVSRGKGEKVNPGFEAGYWHARKRTTLMEENHIQSDLPMVPFVGKAWKPFPSVHIPEGFHVLDILDYFEAIPDIDFSYKEGVVKSKAPAEVPSLHYDSSGDEDGDDGEEDCHEMTFKDLCKRAIRKYLVKGEQFLTSGRLLCMLDTKKDKHYFLKGQVQASMEDKVYGVVIIINVDDGSICSAECLCKAREFKRCGHIAAVLLRLWQHIYTKGCEAVTTTGTHCYWRKSGNPKNPGLLREKQYENKKPVGPRINFDPRPTAFQTDGISEAEIKEFKEDLQLSNPTCLFLYQLDSGFIPSTVMDSEIVIDLQTDEGNLRLADECSKKLWKLAKNVRENVAHLKYSTPEGNIIIRCGIKKGALCVNPSSAKTFLQLQKEITIIKWLRKKVHLYRNFENDAMRTGKRLESTAGKKCETKLKNDVHQNYNIIETGLWKNPKYPQMACSPDGLITFPGEKNKLLEIKVLTMVNYNSPECDEGDYNLEEEEDNPDNPEEDGNKADKKGGKKIQAHKSRAI